MLCNYYEDNFSLIIAGENMKKRCVFATKIAKPAAKNEWSFFYFGKKPFGYEIAVFYN